MTKAALTPEFRISFCNLFQPKANMNGRLQFDVEMMFAKPVTAASMAELKVAHDGAIKPAWIHGGEDYRKFGSIFVDGDKKKQASRKGNLLLKAWSSSEFPPKLVMPNPRIIATNRDIYPGCYARAILTPFHYEHKNEAGHIVSRGVAFGLHTVQKTRNGDPLTNVLQDADAEEMLLSSPIEDEEEEYANLLG